MLGSSARTQPNSKPTLLLKVPCENKDVGFKKNEPNLRKLKHALNLIGGHVPHKKACGLYQSIDMGTRAQ